MPTHQRLILLFATLSLFFAASCRHVPLKPLRDVVNGEKSLTNRAVSMLFVPENRSTPASIVFAQKDRYYFGSVFNTAGYKLETTVDPLMRNFFMVARIEKNGKTIRQYTAQKNATSILSDKKTTWSPARAKMIISIPYLGEGEEVVVSTSYEWMDTRFMPPIFLQEDGLGAQSSITLDIPYGVTMHFKSAKDHESFAFIPENLPHENKLWVSQDNQAGLGLRYLWQSTPGHQSVSNTKADLLQLYLAFDTPIRNESLIRFDNWSEIASYLYNRIDRYDMASNEIQAFASEHVKGLPNDQAKVKAIFSFLKNDVERRSALGSFNEQPAQPATRTFARKFGSAFDIVILGKALLASAGVESSIVVASDKRFNPNINDFFAPTLFSSVLLRASTSEGTFYYDPESEKNSPSELNKNLQGQNALVLKPSKGEYFRLPYDSAHKHGHTLTYQLWINDDGMLLGEYSIDLLGFDVLSLGEPVTDTAALETKLKFLGGLPYSLASAEIVSQTKNEVRLFGQIKPTLLMKNGQNFELNLQKLLAPIMTTITSAKLKGYSQTAKLALLIDLPDGLVVKNLPTSVNLSFDGVQGRFSVSNMGHELVVEAMSVISLPIAGDEKIAENLKNLQVFSEHSMIIGGDTVQGALDAKDPPVPKNP